MQLVPDWRMKKFEIFLGIITALAALFFLLSPITHTEYLLLDVGGSSYEVPVPFEAYTAQDWVERSFQVLALITGAVFVGDGIRRGFLERRASEQSRG